MNQNLEELKELLMYSYRKLGYTVTTDKDMLYLRSGGRSADVYGI